LIPLTWSEKRNGFFCDPILDGNELLGQQFSGHSMLRPVESQFSIELPY